MATITPLPPLDRTAPSFKADVDTYFGTLIPAFGVQLEATRIEVGSNATASASSAATATTQAGNANTSAANAAQSEANAASSAATALSAPGTSATSTTSQAPGTGSKPFILAETGKSFSAGQWVSVTDTSAPTINWFSGPITAYNSGTGAITVNATIAVGSSTSTTWAIAASAPIPAPDSPGGFVGLTLYKINMKNVAGTYTSYLTNNNTAARTYTLKDADGTVPLLETANTFTAAQVYSDQQISRGMTKDMGAVYVDKGNSGTSTQTLDYTAGSHQKITVTGAHTIATSNWPPTGNLGEMLLELVNGASSVVTWPTVNWVKSDGSTTTTFSSNGVTLQTSGTDWVMLWSRDAGATIFGKVMR